MHFALLELQNLFYPPKTLVMEGTKHKDKIKHTQNIKTFEYQTGVGGKP